MNKYLFSSKPHGTYDNEWDISSAVAKGQIWFWYEVPLVKRLRTGDTCYLRTYSRGLFAKAELGRIDHDGRVYKVGLENLEAACGVIPQDAFFCLSSNGNIRSRIIGLTDSDAQHAETLMARAEDRVIRALTLGESRRLDASEQKAMMDIRRMTLYGN